MIRETQNQIQIIEHLQKDTLQTIALGTGNSMERERGTVASPSPTPAPLCGFTFPVSIVVHISEADDPPDVMSDGH